MTVAKKPFSFNSHLLPKFYACILNKNSVYLDMIISIKRGFYCSMGLTSMSGSSSFRHAVLSKIILAQY
ncbi:hypothetical protein GCM10028827_38640 [Mucilaginibacter myungsuensis]